MGKLHGYFQKHVLGKKRCFEEEMWIEIKYKNWESFIEDVNYWDNCRGKDLCSVGEKFLTYYVDLMVGLACLGAIWSISFVLLPAKPLKYNFFFFYLIFNWFSLFLNSK